MSTYTKIAPYFSSLFERELLNKEGSTKSTYHLSLAVEPGKLDYKPGDSIAILPCNHTEDIQRILALIPNETILHPKTGVPVEFREYLHKMANLERITTPLLRATNTTLEDRLSYDVVTFLEKTGPIDPTVLAKALPPLLPRFYSIASSNKEKIDLLISTFHYKKGEREKSGACSDYLCHTADIGDTIPLYVAPNKNFTLPPKEVPIIMIGPGTGVAPYRAFLQEREKETTKNWLFFGERNKASDYYYEEYFTHLECAGKLRLSTAFSRDQSEKIYVQHRLLEESQDIWAWINQGAVIYVCGDAKKMAKDVDSVFHKIAEREGSLSPDEAHLFIRSLRKNKQYLIDVY
jgi:sulfite reductase (NADPH) flavoprotein alpha-component